MKKALIILLTLILTFSFTACTKNGRSADTANGDQTAAAESGESSDGDTIEIGSYKIKLTKEANHGELYFKENVAEMELAGYDQTFNMYFNKDEGQIFVIRLVYFRGSSIDEVMSGSDTALTDKTVNGIQYKYFEFEENGAPSHNYVYNFNGTTYMIVFVSSFDMTSLETVFLNNVHFEKG
jgi:hypothetical protein